MKYIFFLTLSLSLSLTTLSAQSSSRSVTETSSDDGYKFSVKLDKKRSPELLAAFEEVIGKQLKVKVTGLIFEEYDNGVVLELNTRRNQLSVAYGGDDETSQEEARKMAGRIKDILHIAPAPAPPH